MSLLLALLNAAPEPTKRGSNGTQKKPRRTIYEVDRFSDFAQKPLIKRSDDDELMIILMM